MNAPNQQVQLNSISVERRSVKRAINSYSTAMTLIARRSCSFPRSCGGSVERRSVKRAINSYSTAMTLIARRSCSFPRSCGGRLGWGRAKLSAAISCAPRPCLPSRTPTPRHRNAVWQARSTLGETLASPPWPGEGVDFQFAARQQMAVEINMDAYVSAMRIKVQD